MRKPKLGLLHLTCPTHLESKNDTGDYWVNKDGINEVRQQLIKNNLEIVEFDKIVGYFYELPKAEKLLNKKDMISQELNVLLS